MLENRKIIPGGDHIFATEQNERVINSIFSLERRQAFTQAESVFHQAANEFKAATAWITYANYLVRQINTENRKDISQKVGIIYLLAAQICINKRPIFGSNANLIDSLSRNFFNAAHFFRRAGDLKRAKNVKNRLKACLNDFRDAPPARSAP